MCHVQLAIIALLVVWHRSVPLEPSSIRLVYHRSRVVLDVRLATIVGIQDYRLYRAHVMLDGIVVPMRRAPCPTLVMPSSCLPSHRMVVVNLAIVVLKGPMHQSYVQLAAIQMMLVRRHVTHVQAATIVWRVQQMGWNMNVQPDHTVRDPHPHRDSPCVRLDDIHRNWDFSLPMIVHCVNRGNIVGVKD